MVYLFFALGVVVVAVLAMWQADPDGTWGWILRSAGITILGGALLVIGLHWLADLIGLRPLGNVLVIFYLIAGCFLVLSAVFRFQFYWKVLEISPFFQDMSDAGRSRAIALIGCLFLFVGAYSLVGVVKANAWCESAYAGARSVPDSIRIDAAVPDSSLHMPRGRFNFRTNPPFTCQELRED